MKGASLQQTWLRHSIIICPLFLHCYISLQFINIYQVGRISIANMSSNTEVNVLAAAHHIVEQISDYYTLISLSMTCTLLYDLITARESLRTKLFRRLEAPEILSNNIGHLYGCKGKLDCWCNSLRQSYGEFEPNWQSSDLARYGGLRFKDSNS